MEADQRHIELILKQMGLTKCKGSDVVGVQAYHEDGIKMSPAEAKQFRSVAARCNFLAADRIDIQFACKEVCGIMAVPCTADWAMLKKIARYLQSHSRLLMEFKFQEEPLELKIFVDTDFGGCRRTRRSTNGGLAMLGNHLIKSWSTTQTTAATLKWQSRVLWDYQRNL